MNQAFHPIFFVSCIGLLAGCTAYRAEPLDRRAELDALRALDVRYVVAEQAKPGQSSNSKTTFDLSDGLNESEVVAVALSLNPELRAKRAEIGETQAALISAGMWPNPELGVSVRPGFDGASGTAIEADLMFQLLRPGERDAQKKAAKAHVEEVQAGLIAEEFIVVAEVRRRRLDVLASERALAFLKETVDRRQRAADLVRRQRELGEANELEISATRLEIAEAQRDLRKAQAELDAHARQLNQTLGLPPDYVLKLTEFGAPLTVTMFEDVSDEELDRRMLAGRLELVAKEAAYQRSEQNLRLAVLKQYPRLSLGPSFEKDLDGGKSLGLGLSLELPLLNQNQGEIAEMRAARARSRAEYSALLHRLRADAFAARATVRAAKSEVEVQEKEILPLLRKNQKMLDGAYRTGQLNIFNWMTAQQRALSANREYLDAVVRYRIALIDFETATGRPSGVSMTGPATQPN